MLFIIKHFKIPRTRLKSHKFIVFCSFYANSRFQIMFSLRRTDILIKLYSTINYGGYESHLFFFLLSYMTIRTHYYNNWISSGVYHLVCYCHYRCCFVVRVLRVAANANSVFDKLCTDYVCDQLLSNITLYTLHVTSMLACFLSLISLTFLLFFLSDIP